MSLTISKEQWKEWAESVDEVYETKQGKDLVMLEDYLKSKFAMSMFSLDHKKGSYDKEVAYHKGKFDAIQDLVTLRHKLKHDLKKGEQDD